jgi:hypothetical protein
LDTRAKIRNLSELRSFAAQSGWAILAGQFDPLTAETVERIENAILSGRKLLVVVRSAPDDLLSAEARAVLLAGLRAVDAVFIAETDEWRSLVGGGPLAMLDDDGGACIRHEFEALVLARQEAAAQA